MYKWAHNDRGRQWQPVKPSLSVIPEESVYFWEQARPGELNHPKAAGIPLGSAWTFGPLVVFALFYHVNGWSQILRWAGWHRETVTKLAYEIDRCLHVPLSVLMGLRIYSVCIRMVLWLHSISPVPGVVLVWDIWSKENSTNSFGSVDRRSYKQGFTPVREEILSMKFL